jgi:Uma2 family endonuclease
MTTARAPYQSPLTLEEFLALPEEQPALEFNPDGSISQKVSPTSDHAELQAHIARFLLDHIDAHLGGRGHVYTELRVNVGGVSRLPDVAFYHQRPRRNARGHALVVPNLAVEIRSPGESLDEQRAKCQWWQAQGARAVFLVDADNRALEQFVTPGVEPPPEAAWLDVDIFAILDRP